MRSSAVSLIAAFVAGGAVILIAFVTSGTPRSYTPASAAPPAEAGFAVPTPAQERLAALATPTPQDQWAHGHLDERLPGLSAEVQARLQAAGVADPSAYATATTDIARNLRTGEEQRYLTLWSYVHVAQGVRDLADCSALGDLARRVALALDGLKAPSVKEPGLSLTFIAGPEKHSITYTDADLAATLRSSQGGAAFLRAGAYSSAFSGAWSCFP